MTKIARQQVTMTFLIVLILSLLAFQFVVGMAVNLYYQIPKAHPGINATDYLTGVDKVVQWSLTRGALTLKLHVWSGLALLVASVFFLIFTVSFKRRNLVGSAVVGLLAILMGAFNGASFLIYAKDYSSLIMAIGFLIAYSVYISSLFRNK
jgi:hypothetical protein